MLTAVVGAGGKSTYINNLADRLAAQGQKVAITTTTHIYASPDRNNISVFGEEAGDGKLSSPGEEFIKGLAKDFDRVLVEADGAKHFPIKIPGEHEPVIPADTDEIVVIMGEHATGRRFGEACFRFREGALEGVDSETVITEEMTDRLAEQYYIRPLRERYPGVPVRYIKSRLLEDTATLAGRRLALVLPASGESRRFGSNKLIFELDGKPLFRYGLEALAKASGSLKTGYGIEAQVFVVSDHLKVRELAEDIPGVSIVPNPGFREGMASSIRLGAEAADKGSFDAVLYLNADMPYFPAADIEGLVIETLCSGKDMGCAFCEYPSNPALFSAGCFEQLMQLRGDLGAMKLIRKKPWDVHFYVTGRDKLKDIDRVEEVEKCRKEN